MPEDSFTEIESSFQCSDRPTVNVIISMIAFDLFNCCGTHFFLKKAIPYTCLLYHWNYNNFVDIYMIKLPKTSIKTYNYTVGKQTLKIYVEYIPVRPQTLYNLTFLGVG